MTTTCPACDECRHRQPSVFASSSRPTRRILFPRPQRQVHGPRPILRRRRSDGRWIPRRSTGRALVGDKRFTAIKQGGRAPSAHPVGLLSSPSLGQKLPSPHCCCSLLQFSARRSGKRSESPGTSSAGFSCNARARASLGVPNFGLPPRVLSCSGCLFPWIYGSCLIPYDVLRLLAVARSCRRR
jgi:hypothetical protein